MSAGATTNEWNSFYGTVVIAQAGQLRFGNTGAALTNGGTNAIWDIEGEVDVRNTGMVELGALVGSSSGLIGIDSPTVSGEGTFVIGGAYSTRSGMSSLRWRRGGIWMGNTFNR